MVKKLLSIILKMEIELLDYLKVPILKLKELIVTLLVMMTN